MLKLDTKTLKLLSVEQQIFEMAKELHQYGVKLEHVDIDSTDENEYRIYHSSRYCVTSREVETEQFYDWQFDGDQFEGFVPITAEEFVRLMEAAYHSA